MLLGSDEPSTCIQIYRYSDEWMELWNWVFVDQLSIFVIRGWKRKKSNLRICDCSIGLICLNQTFLVLGRLKRQIIRGNAKKGLFFYLLKFYFYEWMAFSKVCAFVDRLFLNKCNKIEKLKWNLYYLILLTWLYEI